jgi:apolipoprotein N-acyltransferase
VGDKKIDKNIRPPLFAEAAKGKKPILRILVGMAAATALLLTFCQAPWDWSFLAWFALVPFVLVSNPQTPKKHLILTAYLISFLYWLGNLYWIIPITGPGYVFFALWQAIYWPGLALGVRYLRAKNWPMVMALPILFVGAESIQSFLFTGFNWYFLAHSQYANTALIQIADLFGTFGISALIAAVNGVLADMILAVGEKTWHKKRLWVEIASMVVLIFAVLFYGLNKLTITEQFLSPQIGIVQSNVPSAVKEETENAQAILNDLITQSNQCVAAGAELVVWPETMVLTPLNPGYRMYCDPNSESVRFNRQIEDYAGKTKRYLLVGAPGAAVGEVNGRLDVTERFNSAYLYEPDGRQSGLRYDKIHLVPFGEFIPCKKTCPPLYKLFMSLNPYEYDYTLTPGGEYTLFPVRLENRDYHFGVLICYEDTDPAISRRLVYKNGGKSADWLINISNDGWYVRLKNGKVIPSVELAQRTAICVFRCIENRISLIRSVNTGVSCLIDPYGRIQNQYLSGDLPKNGMERQGMAGWFVDDVPLDSQITFYTKYGDRIDKLPAIALCLIVSFLPFWSRRTLLQLLFLGLINLILLFYFIVGTIDGRLFIITDGLILTILEGVKTLTGRKKR